MKTEDVKHNEKKVLMQVQRSVLLAITLCLITAGLTLFFATSALAEIDIQGPARYLTLLSGIILFALAWILAVFHEKELVQQLAVTILAIYASLFAIEILLAIYIGIKKPEDLIVPRFNESQAIYESHPYTIYQGRPNYHSIEKNTSHNSLGFRGPELMQHPALRVILHGGSTVYGSGVESNDETWSAQVQKILQRETGNDQIEVINAGLGGYTSYESLIQMQFRTAELKPQIDVIYFGVNDCHARNVDPKYYFPDNTGYRKSWDEIRYLSYEHILENPLLRYSNLIRFLYVRVFRYTVAHVHFSISELTMASTAEYGRQNNMNYKKNPPVYFERNLRDFVTLVETNQSIPVLVTYLQEGGADACSQELNAVVKKIAAEDNIALLDFANEKDIAANPELWTDHDHMSTAGNQQKAQKLSEVLLPIIKQKLTPASAA